MSDQSQYTPPVDPTLPQPVENVPTPPVPTSSLAFLIKKMGGAKAISSVFGMMLLAAGLGAGLILVAQPQILEEHAQVLTNYKCTYPNVCKTNSECTNANGGTVTSGTCLNGNVCCSYYVPSGCNNINVTCKTGPRYPDHSYCNGNKLCVDYSASYTCVPAECANTSVVHVDLVCKVSSRCYTGIRCKSNINCSPGWTCVHPDTPQSACELIYQAQ